MHDDAREWEPIARYEGWTVVVVPAKANSRQVRNPVFSTRRPHQLLGGMVFQFHHHHVPQLQGIPLHVTERRVELKLQRELATAIRRFSLDEVYLRESPWVCGLANGFAYPLDDKGGEAVPVTLRVCWIPGWPDSTFIAP